MATSYFAAAGTCGNDAILESLGFLTSVHRMGDHCELHAVKLPEGAPVYARDDNDIDDGVFTAVCC